MPALSNAIFAINTLLHPDASESKDVDKLEAEAEATLDTLITIREWMEANPEWAENNL